LPTCTLQSHRAHHGGLLAIDDNRRDPDDLSENPDENPEPE